MDKQKEYNKVEYLHIADKPLLHWMRRGRGITRHDEGEGRMKRGSLLLAMAALVCVLAATLFYGSPYAPVVEPAGDIEQIWEIEDARVESERPLVTVLENGGVPLAYDAAENVFYCTLGMGHGEEWPQLHLTAPGAKGIRLVFVDDYSYDWCSDALFSGYPYQIMAYTDTEYAYMDVVFTGLPLVQLETDEEVTELDTPARVKISTYSAEPVRSRALVHYRGGGSLSADKKSYKVDFVRDASGKGNRVNLPGFGLREDVILSGLVTDRLLLRDAVTWTMYDKLMGDKSGSAFSARKTAYTELFVNNEYRGIYLMMEPMKAEDEIGKAGGSHLLTDSAYRSIAKWFIDDKYPLLENPQAYHSYFEARYVPSAAQPFAALERYCQMLTCEDDETFIRLAEDSVDMDALVRYVLLMQAGAMTDNVYNNMYIWAKQTAGGMRYVFAPWDLDMTWGRNDHILGSMYENWLTFTVGDRILALNAGGAAQKLVDQWKIWRENIFTVETVEEIVMRYSDTLSNSGAIVRNAMRWDLTIDDTGGSDIVYAAQMRFEAVDRAVEQIEQMLAGGDVPAFLLSDESEQIGIAIYGAN